MGIFSKKSNGILGLDISSTAIKVVELEKSGNNFRLLHYSIESLPQNSVSENSIADVDQVSSSITRAIKRSGARSRNVATAIPGSHVISKRIFMPHGLREDELESQITLEADHYIPYPLDEVNMDFEVLGPAAESPNEDEILLVACRKEIVDDYIAVLEDAGLTPTILDVEYYAVENAYQQIVQDLPGGGMEKLTAVMDFGATTLHVNVIQNNRSIYTRNHSFGGNQLTEEIQRRYGLSLEEAVQAKKVGGLPDNYQPEILRPFMEAMCQEAMRGLQFFYSSSQHDKVDAIMLAGGCAQIQGVDELLSSKAGLPVDIANPFSNMSLSPKLKAQSLALDAPSLMVACGLALRGDK